MFERNALLLLAVRPITVTITVSSVAIECGMLLIISIGIRIMIRIMIIQLGILISLQFMLHSMLLLLLLMMLLLLLLLLHLQLTILRLIEQIWLKEFHLFCRQLDSFCLRFHINIHIFCLSIVAWLAFDGLQFAHLIRWPATNCGSLKASNTLAAT